MQIASLTLLLTGPVSWSITCGFSKRVLISIENGVLGGGRHVKTSVPYVRCMLSGSLIRCAAGLADIHLFTVVAFQTVHDSGLVVSVRAKKNGWFLESVTNLKMAGATHAETSFWHKPAGAVRSCCNNEKQLLLPANKSTQDHWRRHPRNYIYTWSGSWVPFTHIQPTTRRILPYFIGYWWITCY